MIPLGDKDRLRGITQILLDAYCSGGVDFAQTTAEQAFGFQCNVLKTILQLEETFFEMADQDQGDVLIICDRGTMDPSACECVTE